MDKWRSMAVADQVEFLQWSNRRIQRRLVNGQETYKSDIYGFQGDPLEHLADELLDALVYCWYLMRQIGDMTDETD